MIPIYISPGRMGHDKDRKRSRSSSKKDSHKRKRRKSSKGEEEEMQWVEAPSPAIPDPTPAPVSAPEPSPPPVTEKKTRDSWMTTPQRRERRPPTEETPAVVKEEYKPLELNPFIQRAESPVSQEPKAPKESKPMLVGDGGRSWRQKALQRTAERAMEEKRLFSDVAAEQFGDRFTAHRKKEQSSPSSQPATSNQRNRPEGFEYSPEELQLPKNRVKAMLMKAKMKGDKEEQKRLQALLDKTPQEIQMLSGLDERGQRIAARQTTDAALPQIEKGERKSYFFDDQRSLQDLVQEEKLGNHSNQTLAQNIMRDGAYKEPDITRDEEYDPRMYESREARKYSKMNEEEFREAMMQKQVKADTYYQKLLDDCHYCFESPKVDKKSMVSLGNHCYLAIPSYGQLVPGHCMIVPMTHCISMRKAEEEVWDELQQFKKFLQRMYADNGLEAVFMETARQFKKQRHTVVECIPLPKEQAEDAPFYFSKEMTDSGSQWSSNPKLIHCREKGLRRSIPDNFEYFYVEFATGDAFAHVIEGKKFKSSFGREIVCGILDLPYGKKIRKRILSPPELQQMVRSFLNMWKPYDFTQYLDGGEYDEEETTNSTS